MTKCIVLGEKPTEVKKKPIEFLKFLTHEFERLPAINKPNEFKFIELICLGYMQGLDLMYAYGGDRNKGGVLYLGKWNDGVAE